MLPKITVIKLKRQDAFDRQKYKVLIGNDELTDVSAVSVSMTANEIPITTVNIHLKTTDFQWLNEEDATEPLVDGSTG